MRPPCLVYAVRSCSTTADLFMPQIDERCKLNPGLFAFGARPKADHRSL